MPTHHASDIVPSGDLRDPDGMPGVSDATAALIRLGTKTRNSKEHGGDAGRTRCIAVVGSGQDERQHLPEFADGEFRRGAGDARGRPAQPDVPAGRAGQVEDAAARQLEQAKSQPGIPGATTCCTKLLYPHDARSYTHPTVASLDKITRETIMEHYKKYYVPSGEWAGISGDITPGTRWPSWKRPGRLEGRPGGARHAAISRADQREEGLSDPAAQLRADAT